MSDDLTRIAEDDRLLDALARGETPAGDDRVVALLGEWRAALPESCQVPVHAPRRRLRRSLVAAALVLIAGGGVSAAAEHAEPDSPLWPVTQLLYGDLADSRAAGVAAEEAVTVAAEATETGRYEHATELLDQAAALVDRVDNPDTADELRNRIAAVRARIAAATGGLPAEGTGGTGGTEGSGGSESGAGTPEVPVPPALADPPPAHDDPVPGTTPESGQGTGNDSGRDPGSDQDGDQDGGPGNGNGNGRPGNDPPGNGPPAGVLPTVPGVPVPGNGPGQ